MAIENKEELVKRNAVLEAEIVRLQKKEEELNYVKKQLSSTAKTNEEITANEHNMRQMLEKTQQEFTEYKKMFLAKEEENKKVLEIKEKEISNLKLELNKLAVLFDEYIVAYQDQVKMLGVFVKNTQTVEKYLSVKINEFNGGDKK
jgi:hypothetical protein